MPGGVLRSEGPVLVAIGANLPGLDGAPPLAACRRATARLAALPGLRLAAVSNWHRSAPVPPSGQPDYVNGAARLEIMAGAAIDPAALLAALHAIEAEAGRRRGAANAARTLDLDLLAVGGLARTAPDPVLPHPRLHQRGFVLRPLAEVAADWLHPLLGRNISALLRDLPEGEAFGHATRI